VTEMMQADGRTSATMMQSRCSKIHQSNAAKKHQT